MKDYRSSIYSKYIDSIFGKNREGLKLDKDYDIHRRYFKRNYLKYLPKDTSVKILDAGCGLGHFLYALTKEGYQHVNGVDISEELINFCKKKGFKAINSPLADYLKNNVNMFDVIIFNDVIEHMNRKEIFEVIQLMYNSLKKDGIILIKTPNMANPITASGGRYIDFTHEIGFTEVSMRELLFACDFNDIKVVGTDIYIFYLNPLNYIAKFSAFIISGLLYILSHLYGRKTLKIFDKDILAIAKK